MKWFTLALPLLLVCVIVAANVGWAQPLLQVLHDVPFADKVCHFLLSGGLCYLVMATVSKVQTNNPLLLRLGAIAVLLALVTADECSQMWFSTRTFSVADLLSNYAGVLVVGVIAISSRTPEPSPS